jgi:peptide chain release factor 2
LAGGGAGLRLAPPTVRRAEVDDNIEIKPVDKELRVDTYSRLGLGRPARQQDRPGGAHHPFLPAGIAVAVQQERSQHLSAKAIQMLKARLYEIELQKREAERLEARSRFSHWPSRRWLVLL